MNPLKKLLKVTPRFFIILEVLFLTAVIFVAKTVDEYSSVSHVKSVLNLSLAAVVLSFFNTHFQIRYSPYLLIQSVSPYQYIRSFLGITILRIFIIHVSFKDIAYLNTLILFIRNICFLSYLVTFVSFSFSLNSILQFHSTKNGKFSLNYIVQATLVLALFLCLIIASFSSSLNTLIVWGIVFSGILSYIGLKIFQSLRLLYVLQKRPVPAFLLIFLCCYFSLSTLSKFRIEKAKNPIEVSLWQAFHFSDISQKYKLDRAFDFISRTNLSCETFFPDTLVQSCEKEFRKRFFTSDFPNTNHPQFISLINSDEEFIQKFSYFYLKTLQIPVSLNEIWKKWIISKANIRELNQIIKSNDHAASSIVNFLVESTPERFEIASILSADLVSRFADYEKTKTTLTTFLPEVKSIKTRLELFEAWNQLKNLNIQNRTLSSPDKGNSP